MKIILTTDEGQVLDSLDVTPDEYRRELARDPHGVLSHLTPGAAALGEG